jgi:hypothetical protein
MTMGIREKLNENPAIAVVIAVVALSVCAFAAYHFLGGPSIPKVDPAVVQASAPAYFTTDDGATTFVDSGSNVAPFDHNGQQAVKAYVYMFNGRQVVAYLEKYSAGAGSPLMVKKRGNSAWVVDSDPAAQAIRNVNDASGHPLTPLTPPND